MASTITLSPTASSKTITAGDAFTAPTATGKDDANHTVAVTGPVWAPSLDASKAGTYVATYSIAQATGVSAASKTFTLTVNAKPTPPSGSASFKDGSKLRDGQAGTAEYKADVTEGNTIQSPDVEVPAKSAALFDEQGLDPYEANNAV
jgi:hypothetical protein